MDSRKYLKKESLVSFFINSFLSLLFLYLVFYPIDSLPVWGVDGLLIDSVIQGFAIGLMASLVPTLITSKRIASGKLNGLTMRDNWLLHHYIIVSLLFALSSAVLALTINFVGFILLDVDSMSFNSALVFKVFFGGVLGSLVTYQSLPILKK
ncbi:hypothetical protein L1D19_18980 [Vibrio natriegens]|uniref:hypothetical protein n=1 Tax=Vibrio natriegens TaxID=691 RepID=UPI001EFC6814|nr:hypothetical protein [Vibrio natriegens]MCG9702170.1 hypothetical protein [Vibrio natriegens]